MTRRLSLAFLSAMFVYGLSEPLRPVASGHRPSSMR